MKNFSHSISNSHHKQRIDAVKRKEREKN